MTTSAVRIFVFSFTFCFFLTLVHHASARNVHGAGATLPMHHPATAICIAMLSFERIDIVNVSNFSDLQPFLFLKFVFVLDIENFEGTVRGNNC